MKEPRSRRTEGEGWMLVRNCPRCGRPEAECRCGPRGPASGRAASGPIIRLRMERRRGKPVTVLAAEGLDPARLEELMKELKSACASGGTVKGGEGELQGDHRERVRAVLRERGIEVRG